MPFAQGDRPYSEVLAEIKAKKKTQEWEPKSAFKFVGELFSEEPSQLGLRGDRAARSIHNSGGTNFCHYCKNATQRGDESLDARAGPNWSAIRATAVSLIRTRQAQPRASPIPAWIIPPLRSCNLTSQMIRLIFLPASFNALAAGGSLGEFAAGRRLSFQDLIATTAWTTIPSLRYASKKPRTKLRLRLLAGESAGRERRLRTLLRSRLSCATQAKTNASDSPLYCAYRANI